MACNGLTSVAVSAAVLFTALRPAHAQDAAAPPRPPTSTPAAVNVNTVDGLFALLSNNEAAQADRDEAAKRLIVMNTPESISAL